MKVFCNRYDCRYQNEGECNAEIISLDEDGECEDYESYLEQKEWQTPYWKRMRDDKNSRTCRVQYYGKQIEINGRKFYIDENSNFAIATDGETGCSCGQTLYVEERFDQIVKAAASVETPLEELPIATYDPKTRTFTYESEVEAE